MTALGKAQQATATALSSLRRSNPKAYAEVCEYASIVYEELARLRTEEPKIAPATTREYIEEQPEYRCRHAALAMGYAVGYVAAAGATLGVAPWDLVDAVSGA